MEHAIRARFAQFALEHGQTVFGADIEPRRVEPGLADLQPAQRLLQRLVEAAADRHHLTHRFHLRGQAGIGGRKFLECKTRDLGDHVVDRRFERCRREASGDVVLQFVQRVTHRQLGGNLGDRKAGRLRRQRR